MNIYYNTAEIFLSDHLPIVALFEAKIKVIDETKRQAVIADARKEFAEMNNKSDESKKDVFLASLTTAQIKKFEA